LVIQAIATESDPAVLPIALVEIILTAPSDPNDWFYELLCGCGTHMGPSCAILADKQPKGAVHPSFIYLALVRECPNPPAPRAVAATFQVLPHQGFNCVRAKPVQVLNRSETVVIA
jgi:hypothetical protein